MDLTAAGEEVTHLWGGEQEGSDICGWPSGVLCMLSQNCKVVLQVYLSLAQGAL